MCWSVRMKSGSQVMQKEASLSECNMRCVSKRTTVTLTDQDLEVLRAVADPARPESTTLRAIADELGVEIRDRSESALIRALLAAGAAVVKQRALKRGYQELAEIYPEVHDVAEAVGLRRRYAHRVDAIMDS